MRGRCLRWPRCASRSAFRSVLDLGDQILNGGTAAGHIIWNAPELLGQSQSDDSGGGVVAWGSRGTRDVGAEYRRNRPDVLERDEFQCQLRFSVCVGRATEVDHIQNFARQGSDAMTNLQAVCGPCHRAKTARESAEAKAASKEAARHPDSLRKHPGYR
ncbi:HNH endonuclease [Nocardia sp. NPDC127526]|uniref:HNH endonuclease n=1 Tax=Nocardia sp. NPDC127526 TaxID=3345393 RepID=UPI00363A132D